MAEMKPLLNVVAVRTFATFVFVLLLPAMGCAGSREGGELLDAKRMPARDAMQMAFHRQVDQTRQRLPAMTALAERIAERHLGGGMLGSIDTGYTLERELTGRSGGLMHFGFHRPWKRRRPLAETKLDIAFVSWDDKPAAGDLGRMKAAKRRGCLLLGFGSMSMPELEAHRKLCDAWFDSDAPALGARGAAFSNAVNAWALTAEFVAACTRRGKMPVFWKGFSHADGKQWMARYFRKTPYHDDYDVPPIKPGVLGGAWCDRLDELIARVFEQKPAMQLAAKQIAEDFVAGKKTHVAGSGHMAARYVGRYGDTWARFHPVQGPIAKENAAFRESAPEGASVLVLGYLGLHISLQEVVTAKKHRVILITAENPRKDWQHPGYPVQIDMGHRFGDACLDIDGYPIRIVPPSGAMQLVVYDTIDHMVMERLRRAGVRPGGTAEQK